MPKRKKSNKVGSKKPSKWMRINTSSESGSESDSEFLGESSSCARDMFEQEQQSLARPARNRRGNSSRNRQSLRNRNVSASSRGGGTRGRKRCAPRRVESNESSRLFETSCMRRGRKSNRPTSRRGGTQGRECRNSVPYSRARPRCAPRRSESHQSSELFETSCMRKGRKSNRQTLRKESASDSSHRGGTRGRKRRNSMQYKGSRSRSTPRRSQKLDSCSARGKKRVRGKIPRSQSVTSSNSSTTLESPESSCPEQFLLIYSEPESKLPEIISKISEIFDANKNDCCKSCGQQITKENKTGKVQVSSAEVQQKQTASSVLVKQNNVEKENQDDEAATAELEQPLEIEQLSRESLNELPEEPEGNFLPMRVHVGNQGAMELMIEHGWMDLMAMQAQTLENFNIDIFNSQASPEEVHQYIEYIEEIEAQQQMDEDSEQNESI